MHDDIELPRAAVLSYIAHAAVQTHHNDQTAAVLVVDIERLGRINQALGMAAGDTVLAETRRRLGAAVRPSDLVLRVGGGKFVVVCTISGGQRGLTAVAQRCAQALNTRFHVDGTMIAVKVNIGVASARTPDVAASDLLNHAEVALDETRSSGDPIRYFGPDLRDDLRSGHELEQALVHAADRSEFVLHYQPIFDLRTDTPAGVEALIRWRRGDELLYPARFLTQAERLGTICTIGEWAISESERQVQRWASAGLSVAGLTVWCNVSPMQLMKDGLAEQLAGAAARMKPARLGVEITESVVAHAAMRNEIDAIRAGNVLVALDDFGTGYASLSFLVRFPVDVLKVDREFVSAAAARERDRAVLEAILALARALEVAPVAEGIETAAELDLVQSLGCQLGQGFLLGRPAAGDELTPLLARRQPS